MLYTKKGKSRKVPVSFCIEFPIWEKCVIYSAHLDYNKSQGLRKIILKFIEDFEKKNRKYEEIIAKYKERETVNI